MGLELELGLWVERELGKRVRKRLARNEKWDVRNENGAEMVRD